LPYAGRATRPPRPRGARRSGSRRDRGRDRGPPDPGPRANGGSSARAAMRRVDGSRERLPARRQHSLDLVCGDDERRQVAHDGRARAKREDAFFLKRVEGGRRVLLELDADEQPEPAHLADAIAAYRAQAVHKLRAALPRIPSEVESADLADRGDRGRACERIAAEGRRVRALGEVADLSGEGDRAHGHAAGDRFREAKDVRRDRVLLDGEERAGPSEARLDLVDDEERAAFGTEPRRLPRELRSRR